MWMLPLLYECIAVVPPPDRPATGDCCLDMIRHFRDRNNAVRKLLVPPTVLEQLVQEPDGLLEASKLDFVMFTGGPLAVRIPIEYCIRLRHALMKPNTVSHRWVTSCAK